MSTLATTTNAAIIADMYEDFKQGNIPHLLERVSNNCEWHVMGAPLLPYQDTYTGKAEIGGFFGQLNELFEFTDFTVNAIHEVNDEEVVCLGKMSAIARTTGKSSGSNWAMHFRLKDGEVVYFQDFYDSAKAADALH